MYRVSKVLNNNGVIAIDMDENKEYVILGKGVGFGKKVSQRFDKPEGCTTYRLEQETERGSAKELVKGIEPEYLEIADAEGFFFHLLTIFLLQSQESAEMSRSAIR